MEEEFVAVWSGADLWGQWLGDSPSPRKLLQPFYGSLDFVPDNPGEPVPEGTFRHLDFLVQNEDITGRCLPPDPD